MDDDAGTPPRPSIADQLNHLFATVRPAGRDRFSYREVSETIRREQGLEISPAYIGHLCKGERDNPGIQQLQALATFFGVPTEYLVGNGDLAAVTRELEKLGAAIARKELLERTEAALGDPGVRVIAMKARGISAEHLQMVSTMLDQVRRIEGLQDEPGLGDGPA